MNTFLFCDIETVPEAENFEQLPAERQAAYKKRFAHEFNFTIDDDEEDSQLIVADHWKRKGGLYAEFGKIVSIAIGRLATDNTFYVVSYCDPDEVSLLNKLCKNIAQLGITYIIGHNFKEFDGPFLMRRMIINKIPVPKVINSAGVKTWELPQGDTMELWSGSQWKHKMGLDLLAQLLGIPSPKEDMDGSQVAETFYRGEYEKIAAYNRRDVLTCARVFCALKNFKDIDPNQVKVVANESKA